MSRSTYGVMADFASEQSFLAALKSVRKEGYRRIDTFTPYGVEGEEDVVPRRPSPVAAIMLVAGITGGAGGFFMQWYATRVYWINVGGRPVFSWPSYIPITFELTVLSAALAGVAGMLMLAGLPRLEHPAFSDPRFRRATQDRFFICIRSDEPGYSPEAARAALLRSHPQSVEEVFQ
jgi:hypothetical protein